MKKDIRILLVVINAALFAALIALILLRQTHWQPPKPIPPALSQAYSANFLDDLTFSANVYPQITAQPLFWSSRKPPPEKKKDEVVEKLQNPFDDAKLLGTFFDKNTGGAIIRLGKTKEVIRIVRGQSYKGWKLQDLSPLSALLIDASNHQITMQLEQGKQAGSLPPEVGKSSGVSSPNGAAAFDRWVPNEPPPIK